MLRVITNGSDNDSPQCKSVKSYYKNVLSCHYYDGITLQVPTSSYAYLASVFELASAKQKRSQEREKSAKHERKMRYNDFSFICQTKLEIQFQSSKPIGRGTSKGLE
jgi:hypothetical protein